MVKTSVGRALPGEGEARTSVLEERWRCEEPSAHFGFLKTHLDAEPERRRRSFIYRWSDGLDHGVVFVVPTRRAALQL